MLIRIAGAAAALAVAGFVTAAAPKADGAAGVTVDKEHKTVTVEAVIAPREVLKDGSGKFQIYPIEVFACHSKEGGGQKAHETVLNVSVKASEVHKAIESLGLKPGKPGFVGRNKAQGPEIKMFIEWDDGGKAKRIPAEDSVVDIKTGKKLGERPNFKWLFTGSSMVNPDPEKDDVEYGANVYKTLVGIYPVTDYCCIQTNQEEGPDEKLETNAKILPKIGTKVKLIIQVPK